MADEQVIGTTLAHADFGSPDYCGCLIGIIREQGLICCSECDAIIRTVPASDLQRTLDAMELSLDLATAKCPHCGAELIAFVGDNGGKSVKLRDDPNVDRSRSLERTRTPSAPKSIKTSRAAKLHKRMAC
jgi:hypothetical protein